VERDEGKAKNPWVLPDKGLKGPQTPGPWLGSPLVRLGDQKGGRQAAKKKRLKHKLGKYSVGQEELLGPNALIGQWGSCTPMVVSRWDGPAKKPSMNARTRKEMDEQNTPQDSKGGEGGIARYGNEKKKGSGRKGWGEILAYSTKKNSSHQKKTNEG